ncbi:efflux RND transporter periplasmic adaptor subunit [Thalassomonas actiniarum]|uniref:HlyD family efflux transporter periplasmic adaptor subunit n=1 Tax=Thalassomonas actiniarum TaxID=485447 RepID=A0AAE9YRG0_9GAMM|nr:HlyD family efflux transporter periplasmic adaptor subunit [Thalassomonas actiniarum]WDD99845.1 HlyD family efflux transporter periplasmic adaptor subunit [Thalassomonas actiniarum]
MKVKQVKYLIKLLLGLVVVALLIFAFIPEPVKVDMFTVAKGNLLVTLEGEGKTRIHDIYTVYAPIDGRITRIESEPGDRVTAAETIIANMFPANPQFLDKRRETQAKADIEGARAALSLAKARVKQAQAELEFELSDFKRTELLYRQQTVSKAHLERAQLRIKTLKAELETALSNQEVMESRLAAARAMLVQPEEQEEAGNGGDCHICIHSPVDGRVLRILHKSESIVAVGTPLVEIGNPADLEVSIEMLSTNAVKVKPGDEALIKRWGGEQDIRARVRLIEPSGFTKISALGVEEQRVNVILAFTDPAAKWQSLGDAFRVEAAIIIDKAENVISVPLSALFRQEEQWSVFKVVDGYVVLQQVEVGRRNDRFAEITSGLQAGEQVISYPGNKVSAGVRVEKR